MNKNGDRKAINMAIPFEHEMTFDHFNQILQSHAHKLAKENGVDIGELSVNFVKGGCKKKPSIDISEKELGSARYQEYKEIEEMLESAKFDMLSFLREKGTEAIKMSKSKAFTNGVKALLHPIECMIKYNRSLKADRYKRGHK